MLDAKMKLPMFSIFQTPNGFTKIHAQGTLNLNQKSSFSIGAIKREVNFEEFHFAENLLTMNFFGIFNKIQTQNVTLEYQIDNVYVQAAQDSLDTNLMAEIKMTLRVPPA